MKNNSRPKFVWQEDAMFLHLERGQVMTYSKWKWNEIKIRDKKSITNKIVQS